MMGFVAWETLFASLSIRFLSLVGLIFQPQLVANLVNLAFFGGNVKVLVYNEYIIPLYKK